MMLVVCSATQDEAELLQVLLLRQPVGRRVIELRTSSESVPQTGLVLLEWAVLVVVLMLWLVT